MSRAFVYGDNVDTDAIIPARHLTTSNPTVLAAYVLEDLDPAFAQTVRPGDVIVAGDNFGCGSSREHAATAIAAAGVSAVVACSFARIFFRNAINTGLPVLVCADAVAEARPGDEIKLDVPAGRITNTSRGSTYQAEALPDFVTEIVAAGGLVEWVRRRLAPA